MARADATRPRPVSNSGFEIDIPSIVAPSSSYVRQGDTLVLDGALADDQRTENILRARASIAEDILVGRRTRDIFIAPDQALAYGLVHGVSEFSLPRGNQIAQI